MFSDRTCISHLGLPRREETVLRSLFLLVPALQESFDLLETREAARADVIFVNTAEQPAVDAWQEVARRNQMAVPVLVVDGEIQPGGQLQVRRPLVLKKLLGVLDEITSTRTAASQPRTAASAASILVVDDSFPVRKYMEHSLPRLASMPVDVTLAESGTEAQTRFEDRPLDLVFLDIVMPDIDGYKLCKWMKARRKDIPVVLLSSRSGSFDKVRGAVAGCNAYLTKPPEDEELRRVLERFIQADALRTLKSA